jgi:hypothetical protein
MKTRIYILLLAAVGLAGPPRMVGFDFQNDIPSTVAAPVYGPEPSNPMLPKTGNTPAGLPSGTQSYGGAAFQVRFAGEDGLVFLPGNRPLSNTPVPDVG